MRDSKHIKYINALNSLSLQPVYDIDSSALKEMLSKNGYNYSLEQFLNYQEGTKCSQYFKAIQQAVNDLTELADLGYRDSSSILPVFMERFSNIHKKLNDVFESIKNPYIEEMYNKAQIDIATNDVTRIQNGISILETIGLNYKDAQDLVNSANTKIPKIRNSRKKLIMSFCIIGLLLVAGEIIYTKVIIPNNKYNTAVDCMNNGDYKAAIDEFKELGSYKDAQDLYKECNYENGIKYIDSKQWSEAINYLNEADDYQDASKYLNYAKANNAFANGNYEEASSKFAELSGFLDSDERYDESVISRVKTTNNMDLLAAIRLYDSLHTKDQKIQNELSTWKSLVECSGSYTPNRRVLKETGEELDQSFGDGYYVIIDFFVDAGVAKVEIKQLLTDPRYHYDYNKVPVNAGEDGYDFSVPTGKGRDNYGTMYFSSHEMRLDTSTYIFYLSK